LFTEAIPNLLIQSAALIQSEEKTKGAMASLFISACSTGMISTSMTYDIVSTTVRPNLEPFLCFFA
jgi:hypothetical protein